MRSILMLFEKKSVTDPEEFINPNITSVNHRRCTKYGIQSRNANKTYL